MQSNGVRQTPLLIGSMCDVELDKGKLSKDGVNQLQVYGISRKDTTVRQGDGLISVAINSLMEQ